LRAALDAGERALALFEARGNERWAWRALVQLSPAENARGEWARSLAYCARALEYGVHLRDVRLRISALARTASTHAQRGDWSAALSLVADAVALGPPPYEAAVLRAIRGYALVHAGQAAAEGVKELTAALAWCEQSSLVGTRAQFSLWLLEGLLAIGDRERAQAAVDEVLATTRRLGYRLIESTAVRLAGELKATTDPAGADALLAMAEQGLEEAGAASELAKALMARGALGRLGDRAAARASLMRALALFERCGTIAGPDRVRALLIALDLQGATG
jgi:tetratricopeptide (TPR) repeat protein